VATKLSKNFWGLSHEPLVVQHLSNEAGSGQKSAKVIVHLGKKASAPKPWQAEFVDTAANATSMVRVSDSANRVKMLVSPLVTTEAESDPALKTRVPARLRDAMGLVVSTLERLEVEFAEIDLHLGKNEVPAAILGLELALYRFKRVFRGELSKLRLSIKINNRKPSVNELTDAALLGLGMNVSRHLVNLPPNELNPVTYATFAQGFLAGLKGIKVDIWDEKKLATEGMGLHLGTGQGSASPPRLVHIKYRPAAGKKVPVAIVGKGITFDTGGLDIKPSSGMRLMKKDMGGSASAFGLLYWAARSGLKQSLDVYLALAENSVSAEAMRPSDVLTARNGLTIEIHNTDAEGRLVLADALDVAVTSKDKPRYVINVATLTGAIKVALGSQLAGLFSNDSKLSAALHTSGQLAGDLNWPMPLFQRYRAATSSNFADMVNAVDGFGGAVTAALFLEKFVRDVPWAHFDIYQWKDSADGAWLESGGSGQAIACLADWLKSLK
jgi:leucyl aminopeptidase